jgi:hypothetical protein
MGFLRRNKANHAVPANSDHHPSKSKRTFQLFGSKTPKSTQQADVSSTTKMIFQHKFVTVNGDDIPDANNVTVDSVESIVVMTPEEVSRERRSLQEEVEIVSEDTGPAELEETGKGSNAFAFPDDEMPTPAKITVAEQQQQEQPLFFPGDDEKKEELGIETANLDANNSKGSLVPMLSANSDDDDITEHKQTIPPPTSEANPPLQNASLSDDARTRVERAAGAFVQALTCTAQDVRNCASLPESLGGIAMPATACKPIINQQADHGKAAQNNPSGEHFNAQFARKFLNVSVVAAGLL